MSVTTADVRHVAALARLGLDDAALPALVAELNGILAHMEALQQVDLSEDVPPAPSTTGTLRDDDAASVALERPREAFAPAMRDGFFLVPRLATHGHHGASEDA